MPSSYPDVGSAPRLSAAPRTVPALLSARSEERGDAPALVASGMTLSYAQLSTRVAAMGGALSEQGVGRNDSVLIMSTNRLEIFDAVLGCAWIGAIAVPINPELRGGGLATVIHQAGATAAFLESGHRNRVADAGFDGRVWEFGKSDTPHPGSGFAVRHATVDPLDTAMVLFTSGTTGTPKGVRCPHAQFVHWGFGVGHALELTTTDVLYNCLPLFHTNAINALFQALTAGCTFVPGERFSVRDHWRDAAEAGATATYLLGAMVAMLAGSPESDQDRMHHVRRALAPATPAHLALPFRDRFGVTLLDGFGSTETNFVLGSTVSAGRPGFVGVVQPGYEAVVLDGESPVPDGSPGELVVRTDQPGAFACGYVGDPVPSPMSWRRTGDRVVREADGWFRFVDRIKDIIRRRGENVSSLEVESVMSRHPAVVQVAVFPVPSTLAEDEIMCAVILRDGRDVDPADLLRFAETDLPYFALPRFVDFVDDLPLTDTGKVRKADLTSKGPGEQTWDGERNGYRPTRVDRST